MTGNQNPDNRPQVYSDMVMQLAGSKPRFGRMNDPDGAALLTGECGEEMEFYLVIKDNTIEDIRYHTGNCPASLACGALVAESLAGRPLEDAFQVSASMILKVLGGLPDNDRHCALLTVMTLYKAVGNYLLSCW